MRINDHSFLHLVTNDLGKHSHFGQNRLLALVILHFLDRIEGLQETSTVKVENFNLRNLILVNSSTVCEHVLVHAKITGINCRSMVHSWKDASGERNRRLSQQEHRT